MQRSAIPARSRGTSEQSMTRRQVQPVETEEDYFEPPRSRSSAIRYVDRQGNQVIQRGQQRIVIHDEPPPRKVHWILILGIGMIIMLLLYVGFSMLGNWWTNHQLDATYGFPRTYQVEAVVGHNND